MILWNSIKEIHMPAIPHPQGPECGVVYTTVEEARESGEPAMVIPMGLFMEELNDPHTQSFMSHIDKVIEFASDPITPDELEERFDATDYHETA